jgi:hypothetical protein
MDKLTHLQDSISKTAGQAANKAGALAEDGKKAAVDAKVCKIYLTRDVLCGARR